MEQFVFSGDEIYRVAGVDENAYGPIIGPMTVTGVFISTSYSPFVHLDMHHISLPTGLRDSKKVFTRSPSSYSLGEITALSLVEAAGGHVETFSQLLDFVAGGAKEIKAASSLMADLDMEIRLPIWADFVDPQPLIDWLEGMDIRLDKIVVEVIPASTFNRILLEEGSKSTLDFLKFMEVLNKGADYDVAMCGKLGGTKYYGRLFERVGLKATVIRERRGMSSYRLEDGREIHFILNGDDKFLPIAMASIVGKYIREVFMLLMNRLVGHDETIPWASGYRHDAKTRELMEKLLERYPENEIVRLK